MRSVREQESQESEETSSTLSEGAITVPSSSRYRCLIRLLRIGLLFIVALAFARPVFAQVGVGFSLDLVEVWIRGKVSAEREWNRDLSKSGIAFQMTPEIEAKLRELGAGDDWIRVLRQATYNPPHETKIKRSYSRAELRPLYFGSIGRVTPYVGLLKMHETGGQVQNQFFNSNRGATILTSTPLPQLTTTYGVMVGYVPVALDIEAQFHHDLLLLNLGVQYSPFIPIGATKLRVITSVKPFLGMTRQVLAHFPQQSLDTTEPVVDMLNYTYGCDFGAGLAYHWRPGHWVFAEIDYRFTGTFSRSLRAPEASDITSGFPWSSWSARGTVVRFGIGF